MDIKVKWFYRLGFLLLLFIAIFVFYKLKEIWQPILNVILEVMFPFFVGAFIAYLLHPLIQKLHQNGLQRWLSVLIIYLLFFGCAGMAIYKGTPIFVRQLKDLSENAPLLAAQYERWVSQIETQTENLPIAIKHHIDEGFAAVNIALEGFVEKVINFLLWVIDKIVLLALIPFIAFYMIKDTDYLTDIFWRLVPRKWRKQSRTFIRNIDDSLGGYIRGQLIVCAVIGTLAATFFWIIKIKYPLLLGLLVGSTNVIPYFGPLIGAVPAIIIAATVSVNMIIYVVIIIFGLHFLEGNILSPLIVGKSLKMHPLLIMFSLLIGGEIGGIIGLIIAVPLVAVIKTAILQASEQFRKTSI